MSRPYEQIVTIDFETYFAKDYSLRLKEYNTSGYIRDPQFKSQCVGIKIGEEPSLWVPHEHVRAALNTIDWSISALLCHHTAFDGLILSHHYGIYPAYCLDTLSMGRALHSNGVGASLDELAAYYKLGNKLPDVLNKTKGIRELPAELMDELGQYCAVDVELCYKLYTKMVDQFDKNELDLIDMTIRMFTEPVLEIDIPRVHKELTREIETKAELVEAAGVPKTTLSSNQKFADVLRAEGIEPPTKVSPTTGKTTFAFAKNDLGFQALRQHENERVRHLVEARMAVKSTIGETRASRFLQEASMGKLPVYLSYYGAHTGRWSGGNKLNMQNLRRGGELRKSVLAPPGHVLVVVDSAQIEARMLAWFAGDQELLDLFAAGEDVYKHMASQIYGISVDQINKDQRFVGKVAVLGLGYNMGWSKFQWTLATGAMGPPVIMSDYECQSVVQTYRSTRWKISSLWDTLNDALKVMAATEGTHNANNKLWIDCETNKVYLPNGMFLEYPGLHKYEADESQGEWTDQLRYFDYKTVLRSKVLGEAPPKEKGKSIYGGLFAENITQALSRIVVSDQMLNIERNLETKRTASEIYKVVTMTHDEVVACVPEHAAQATYDMMESCMMVAPSWCSNLPLGAEGGYAKEYSK